MKWGFSAWASETHLYNEQTYLLSLSFGVLAVYILSGLDDFFIDFVALVKGIKPTLLPAEEIETLATLPQKRIAILVPAWRESDVIGRMLNGNASHIEYQAYDFFVGTYPNDPLTTEAVSRASIGRTNIHLCMNKKSGPTSKGQMLNSLVKDIWAFEAQHAVSFDALLLHDCEDVIHPKSLALINRELNQSDLVQVPVFSFPVGWRGLIGATYADEFAESHTKELLVRESLGAAIPSAGVGTAISRALALSLRETQSGNLFNPDSLTEDYELGIRAHLLGFRTRMACACYRLRSGQIDYIATREYFPNVISRSIRQKARWCLGIVIQGWRNLGWRGGPGNLYFLARDRKGILTHPLTILGYALALVSFLSPAEVGAPLKWLFVFGVALMCHRAVQRAVAVARIYPASMVMLIPIRIPLANLINAMAVVRATHQVLIAYLRSEKLKWEKTQHELPALFGELPVQAEVRA